MIGGIIIFLFYVMIVLLDRAGERKGRIAEYESECVPPSIDESDIIYKGMTNTIGQEEVEHILAKRYQYYAGLEQSLKEKFLERVQHFMNSKTFIIKTNEGYKEMPVLVSAAAVQLMFGLNDYLLSFYKYIRIYPSEYLGDGFLKVLAGNVEYNTITIAWNQFLKGNDDLTDGSNVGLHEMSHALYFQKLIIDGHYAKEFCKTYNRLLSECQEAYKTEISGRKNLYSSYADTNLQEFWAETVEIFFERPSELSNQYPSVYEAMKALLNQDPLNKTCPVIHENNNPTLSQNLKKFLHWNRAS
jgi:Mlc titration factor MtfA (ptsG expression regulator)